MLLGHLKWKEGTWRMLSEQRISNDTKENFGY